MATRFARFFRMIGPIAALAITLQVSALAEGTAPTPETTLPEGPLGRQIVWIMEILNSEIVSHEADDLAAHFAPVFLEAIPAAQLPALFSQIQGLLGSSHIEPGPMATTRDVPPTNARFIIAGETGLRVVMTVNIDRETGLINGWFVEPIAAPSTTDSNASPSASSEVTDIDISFQSGDDTVYGSYMSPTDIASPAYGAVIFSGSGPTDRNGNSAGLTGANTNLNLALALADAGIPSLRYDKLGSGETGMASHTSTESIGMDLFLQESRDAVTSLTHQAGLDAEQVILVGHSEGALFALLLAQEMADAGTPPAGLILVAPLSLRYLDVIVDQITRQYDTAAAHGLLSRESADAGIAELNSVRDSLRTDGELPTQPLSPAIAPLFTPSTIPGLIEMDQYDPAKIAAALPTDLPVLILHGGKDQQVYAEHIDHLMTGFAGHDAVAVAEIPDANHLLKVVDGEPNMAIDYANPNLVFAPEAVVAIQDFVAALA